MADRVLEGKTVLMTGAGRGMGRAMAVALADAGAKVAMIDIDEDVLKEAASAAEDAGGRGSVKAIVCDVTDADFTEAVIDRYQAIGLCDTASGTNPFTGVDTRDSLGCERLKRYEGFNKENSKVAVSKGSGTWGGAAN